MPRFTRDNSATSDSHPNGHAIQVDSISRVVDSIRSIQELVSLGIRFIAVTQNIDTDLSNPMSRFFLHLMSAFAEMEVSLIRERTIAGVRAARANGKTLGRPRRIFRRDEVVRLRDKQGLSWRAIAKELEIPVMTEGGRLPDLYGNRFAGTACRTRQNNAQEERRLACTERFYFHAPEAMIPWRTATGSPPSGIYPSACPPKPSGNLPPAVLRSVSIPGATSCRRCSPVV